MSIDLRDRVAIVTGGGRGIGRAIALGYARAGAQVVIGVAQNLAEAEEVAAESASLPGRVEAVHADVTVPSEVEAVVERALSIQGRIDVLVNNATREMRFVNEQFMTDPKPFWEADPAAWRMVIETNVVGVFLMSRAVGPTCWRPAAAASSTSRSIRPRWCRGASHLTGRPWWRSRR